LIPVAGIPFFNLVWGIADGILVMNYMRKDFAAKLPILLLFTIVAEVFTYIALQVGNLSFLGNYNMAIDFAANFVFLIFFVTVSEGLFGRRIHHG